MGGRGASGPYIDHLKNLGSGGGSVEVITDKYKNLTLEQTEKRLRNLTHEELVIFDKDGKVAAAYKGDRTSVSFDDKWINEKGAIVTHGHPKGTEEFGGTFSFADMKNMLNSNWAEHRATASGQGEMNYIIRRTAKSNAKGFYSDINRNYDRLNNRMVRTRNSTFKRLRDEGASLSEATHAARQAMTGVLNSYYKKTAEKYGFEYINRKKDYKYGR